MEGDAGNDILYGGTGSDTYVFNLGDGQDVIFEEDSLADVTPFSSSPLPCCPATKAPPLGGITPDMLTFTPNEAQHTLLIQVGTAGIRYS